MTKIDEYFELLATEGYRPERDETETCIAFKAEGKQYLLQLFERDPDYVRLLSYWELYENTTIEKALRVAGEVNYLMKAVKTSVVPGDRGVAFSFEAFYKDAAHAAPFLARAIDLIDSATSEFFERVREGVPDSDSAAGEHAAVAE